MKLLQNIHTAIAWLPGLITWKKVQNGMFNMPLFISVCRKAYIFAYTFKKDKWKDKPKINNKMDNYRREKGGLGD